MTSLRKASTILSVILAASLFSGAVFGQSQRRSAVKIGAPRQVGKPVKAKQYEIDQRCGRIVWVDGDKAGVIMQSYNVYLDWSNFYYACDPRLNPVAALLNLGINHRNCRIFMIGDGSVEVGDWVFVKQIPPSDGSEEETEESAAGEES